MWGTDQGTNVPEVAGHDQVVDEAALAAAWFDEMSTKLRTDSVSDWQLACVPTEGVECVPFNAQSEHNSPALLTLI
jgi:hypothetical protein